MPEVAQPVSVRARGEPMSDSKAHVIPRVLTAQPVQERGPAGWGAAWAVVQRPHGRLLDHSG